MSDVTSAPFTHHRLTIRPWIDPLVDDHGHDPRSRYVEQFWLGVLGPTATWFLRRAAGLLDRYPDGVDIDLAHTAASMGLSFAPGKATPFARALQRCVMFGVAHQAPGALAVRRRLPPVSARHLRRLPEDVVADHEAWRTTTVHLDELSRAHHIALAMLEAGDEAQLVEHRLIALGVSAPVAEMVADNAFALRATASDDA
jgi:hypothetical protein